MESLGLPVVVVDGGLRVLFANAASIALAVRPRSGFSIGRGCRGTGGCLSPRRSDEAVALRKLVAAAIATGRRGVLRLSAAEAGQRHGDRCVLFVAPVELPASAAIRGVTRRDGAALVTIKAPWARRPPSPELLGILFGFSRAEAEVASGLLGGTTAEDVARARNVRLDTIRTQIRSILAKSESENLRAFENKMGAISAILPGRIGRGEVNPSE